MKKLGLCVLVGLGLSPCAGGMTTGGSPNNSVKQTVVTQYPVEAALLNIYTKPRSEKLINIDDSHFITETEVKPKGERIFENKKLQSSEISYKVYSLDPNGEAPVKIVTDHYFSLDPLVFYGTTFDLQAYAIATQTNPIPKMAEIGESSTFLTMHIYNDSSKNEKIRAFTQTWSLRQSSNNTAWFCLYNSSNLLLEHEPKETLCHCYKINPKGDILASKLSIEYSSTRENSNDTKTFNFISE